MLLSLGPCCPRCDRPLALREDTAGGLDDLLSESCRWKDLRVASAGGDGIDGIEPCGELASDKLWLPVALLLALRSSFLDESDSYAGPLLSRMTDLPVDLG